jgi:hypothetical protein
MMPFSRSLPTKTRTVRHHLMVDDAVVEPEARYPCPGVESVAAWLEVDRAPARCRAPLPGARWLPSTRAVRRSRPYMGENVGWQGRAVAATSCIGASMIGRLKASSNRSRGAWISMRTSLRPKSGRTVPGEHGPALPARRTASAASPGSEPAASSHRAAIAELP